jgi:hypothetical protein
MLISILACESDADLVKAPPFKQKLVIKAFISPSDKISFFNVTSNKKLYGELNTEEPLGSLSGSISDGEHEIALDTCKIGLKLNHEKMQIQYGKTYKLRVYSKTGLSAEAVCTVPEKKAFSIEVDTSSVMKEESIHNPFPGPFRSLNITVKFPDLPGEENFYRIFGTVRGYSQYSTISGYVGFDNEFISDKGMDGRNIVVTMDEQSGYLLSVAKDSLFLNIYLFNSEKPYYQYHESLLNYVDSENPFSEATPMYTNISGGFGVFTSYTKDSLLIRLK